MKKALLLLCLTLIVVVGHATTYYNTTGAAINLPGSWTTDNTGAGAGTAASNFTTAGDIFNLDFAPASALGASVTFGAVTLNVNNTVATGANAFAITFNTLNGVLNILSGASMTFQGTGGLSVTAQATVNVAASSSLNFQSTGTLVVSNSSARLIIASGGTVDMGTAAVTTFSPTTITNNGTFRTASTSATPFATGKDWSNGGTATGLVEYYNTSDQTIIAGTYPNLTCSGSGSTKNVGAITVKNALYIGSNVTFNTAASAVTATGNLTNDGTITMTTGTLTCASDFTNNGTFTRGTGTVAFSAAATGHIITGDMTGANAFYNLSFTGNGGWSLPANVDVINNYTQTGNTAAVTAPSGTLSVGNLFSRTKGTFAHNNGTVSLTGASAQTLTLTVATTFNTLTLAGTGTPTLTVSGTGTVVQPFSIPSGYTVNAGATALTCSSNFTNSGSLSVTTGTISIAGDYTNSGTFNSGTGTVTFNGTTTGHHLSGSMTTPNEFYNLTFSGAGGAWSMDNDVDVAHTFSQTNGTVTAPTGILNLGFTFSHTGAGTFSHNSGTVALTATGTQTLTCTIATTFNNLVLNASGTNTVTTTGTLTVAQPFTIPSNNTLNISTASMTCQSDVTNNGTFTSGTGTLTVGGSLTNAGTFAPTTGTVTFNAADGGTHTISGVNGTNKFNNLTFAGTNSSTFDFGASDATVGGAFTMNNTAFTVKAPSTTLNVAGNFVKNATPTFNANGGTVNLNGAGAQSVTTSPVTFNSLTIDSNNTRTITGSTAITVTNDFTVPSGITLNMAAVAFNANGDFNNNGIYAATTGALTVGSDFNSVGTYTASTGALTVAGDFSSSGTYSVTGAQTLSVGKGWTNSGTFKPATGTVVFNGGDGAAHNISGTLTGVNTGKFNNLTFSGTNGTSWSFGANAAEVAGAFTISNTSQTVTLPSTTLKVAGAYAVASTTAMAHNNGTVELNGTVAQAFPGAGAPTFNNLTISNTTATVSANTTVNVVSALTMPSASTLNMVTFPLAGAFTPSCSGTIQTQCTVNPAIPNGKTWGGQVTYNSTTTAQFVASGTFNNLTISSSTGARTTQGPITTNGLLYINTTSGVTTLGGNLTAVGTVSITGTTSTNILDVTTTPYQISVGGDWVLTATTAANLLNYRTGTVLFNGTGTQNITASGTNLLPQFYNLTIDNGGSLTVNKNTNVTNALTVNNNSILVPAAAVVFNSGAAVGTISGNGTIQVTRTTATADYSNQYKFATNTLGSLTVDYAGAGNQNVNAYTYGTLKTSGGTFTKTAQGLVTVNDGLDVGAGTTLDMGAANRLVAGTAPSYTVNGILKTSVPTSTSNSPLPAGATWYGTGTVEYGATSGAQTVVSGTYYNLTMDNTSGTNAAAGTINVNNTLALGKLTLASNDVVLDASAVIVGASSSNYLVATGTGKLRKAYTADGSFTYPVGDAANYTPIAIDMTGAGYSSAYTGVNVTAAKHPNNPSSTNYLNRYWSVSVAGITSPSWTVSNATYVPGDIVGTESSILAAYYPAGGPAWVKTTFAAPNTLVAGSPITASSADITGLSTTPPTVSSSPDVSICVGGAAALTASGSGDGGVTYSWAPATGLSATTGTAVTATPTVTTVYTVTITDGNNATATATTTVTVNAVPTAAPANDGYICNGGTVNLSANPTGTTTTYTWAGANISATTIQNPTATPTATAVYTLTVTDGTGNSGCASTYNTTVTVNGVPAAAPTNDGYICNGGTVTLTANPSNGATVYSWSGSNLSGTTAQSPTAAPTSSTVYTLTVSDGSGKSGCAPATQYTTAVTVNAAITATAANDGYICAGGTVNLSVSTSGSATTYAWSGADLSSGTVAAPSATPASSTVYTVTITDGSGRSGCSATSTTSVTVNSVPTAAPTNNGYICNGATVTLTANPANGAAAYSWSGSNLSSTTAANPTATPSATTVYTLTVSDGSGKSGCAPATQYTTTVTVNGNASLTSATNSGACVGSDLTLMANGANNVAGYTWAGPNSFTSTDQNPVVSAVTTAAAGVYTVTVQNGAGASCTATYTTSATINTLPNAITGTQNACIGNVTTLYDATYGGTWISSDPTIASVNNTTGIITGVAQGNATITYKHTTTGCYITAPVTINPVPAAISGSNTVCIGYTTTLTNAVSGGSWASSAAYASIGSATGIVSGVNNGTATIYYMTGYGCYASMTITVNPLPAAITGYTSICSGYTSTLASTTAGGTWSSSDISIATVGSSNGVVSGLAAGNATITYQLPTGCYRTVTLTVNQNPAAINGTTVLCIGSSSTLTNATPGGTWSISGAAASIGSATGILTATSAGTTVISYTLGNGCRVTVNGTSNVTPYAIGGVATVCEGLTTALSGSPAGGTWASSATGVATVGTSGVATGVSAGNSTITYAFATGCYATREVTVNPLGSITGVGAVCVGAVTTLSNTSTGGTWSSSLTTRATIGSTSGIVSGVGAGTAVISYTLGTGCKSGTVVTVNPSSAITGSPMACEGMTTTLANANAGGTWSSSNTSVATVGSSNGVVTGAVAGVTTISYVLPTGCLNTTDVTINQFPAAISGASTVCAGSSLSLSNTVSGGTWSSSNASIATVNANTGVVTGVAGGNANISYTNGPGCYVLKAITVSPILPITGTMAACVGMTTTLSDGSAGGTWSISNTSIAAIESTGVVTGASAGNATATYTLPSGCFRTSTVTINPAPTSISGTASVCASLTTTLTGDNPGGTWSSSATTVASVDANSGVVTGVAAGNATITYTMGLNCRVTKVVTVDSSPAITGTAKVCIAAQTTLADAAGAGTWVSANTSVATIGLNDGIVTGVAYGTAQVTYTPASGCMRTAVVTVNANPSAIYGTLAACVGSTVTVADATPGGVSWTIANTAIATVPASSGVVTGVSEGTTTLTYTINTGCFATTTFSVNPVPAAIGGPSAVCAGSTASLTNATAGGTWSSSNTGLAQIGTGTGVITGIAPGTPYITYTIGFGCYAKKVVTVGTNGTISGTPSVCVGGTATLTNTIGSGTWTSADGSIATVDPSTGVVTGAAPGNTTITYTSPAGCVRTIVATVNAGPGALSSTLNACIGQTTTLSGTPGGGTWAGNNSNVAAVGTGGVVTGVAAGTVLVTYTIGSCRGTSVMTVNALPEAITGSVYTCNTGTTTMADATPGGTWSSSNTSLATIDLNTGVITGTGNGTPTITYTSAQGCIRTRDISVSAAPGPVTGSLLACPGANSVVLVSGFTGTWSSSNTSVATIGATNNTVTGVAPGTTTVTFTANYTGCTSMAVVTVNPLPAAIGGVTTVCPGSQITLTDADAGGTWACMYEPIGSTTGILTGVSAGTVPVTYTLSTGCQTTVNVTVYPKGPIGGGMYACVGAPLTLTNGVSGGTWSSSDPTVATIDVNTGALTTVAAGTTSITYTTTHSCISTQVQTVNAAASGGTIFGFTTLVMGNYITLYDDIQNGYWSSSDNNVATVYTNYGNGIVYGVAAGNVTMTYTVNNGCGWASSTYTVSVTSSKHGGNTYAAADETVETVVYPNPNRGEFTIKGSTGTLEDVPVRLEITNMLGQVMLSDNVIAHAGSLEQKVRMSDSIPAGTYSLRVLMGGETKTFQFVINK